MNWLTALVAFAAFMAMLASLVTVGVEAWHKLFGLRRSGLEEMLRALHDNVLRDPAGTSLKTTPGRPSDARRFAKGMIVNPGYAGQGRWWWPRNWPVVRRFFFQPHMESMSQLQFAEQLGQTEIGRDVALTLPEGERRAFLERAVREFDRYGEAQSDYFRRRAKVVSGLLAFVLVAGANVNAFDVYRALATDPALTDRTQALMTGPQAAALSTQLDDARASIGALQAQITAAESNPNGIASLQQALATSKAQADQLQAALSASQSGLSALTDAGLPIGPDRFPYCASPDSARIDSRCPATRAEPAGVMTAAAAPASASEVALTAWEALKRVASLSGFIWLVQMIATAGLLGLGAPFWFSVARSVSAMAGRRPAAAAAAEPAQSTASLARPTKPAIQDLDAALVRTAGAPLTPPRGAIYAMPTAAAGPAASGLATSTVMPAAADGPAQAPPASALNGGMRQVLG